MWEASPAVAASLSIIVVTVLIISYKLSTRGSSAELGPEVEALRDDVEQLADMQEHTRTQLAEMQDRLEFTERLLSAGRESQEDRSE